MDKIVVEWLDPGKSQGRIDIIFRKFILNDPFGPLSHGKEIAVQLSKKGSKAKIRKARVVEKGNQDTRPTEPPSKKRRRTKQDRHIRVPTKQVKDT